VAKYKNHKTSVMREAANRRAEYRKWLIRLAVGLAICLVAIGVYYLMVLNYVIENAPGVTWIAAAVAAAIVGWFGNRFSKTHRAYNGYLAEHGLTNEDVVEFAKNQ